MCSSRRSLGFLSDARESTGDWAEGSLLDRLAFARGVDGCRARPASASERAGIDPSGHQLSAHLSSRRRSCSRSFLSFPGDTGTVVCSFLSAACVPSSHAWRDPLGSRLYRPRARFPLLLSPSRAHLSLAFPVLSPSLDFVYLSRSRFQTLDSQIISYLGSFRR